MVNKILPLVGAALPSHKLDDSNQWIIEQSRPLELQDFFHIDVLNSDLSSHVNLIKSKLDGYGGDLGLHGPFIDLSLRALDPQIRQITIDRHLQVLDAAAELGATHMVVHSPLNFLGMPKSLTNPTEDDESLFEIIHNNMKPIVTRAEQIGCTIVIENIFDQLPVMLTDLVKSFSSDNVRQSLDVGHAYIMHKRGAPPPDYFALEAGLLLAHLHLQDTDGYTDRHWPIGTGHINWHSVMEVVHKLDPQPRVIIELRDEDHIQPSVQWLIDHNLAR